MVCTWGREPRRSGFIGLRVAPGCAAGVLIAARDAFFTEMLPTIAPRAWATDIPTGVDAGRPGGARMTAK